MHRCWKALAESDAALETRPGIWAFREAAEIAATMGDFKVVDRCISSMASSFQADEIDTRLAVLPRPTRRRERQRLRANLAGADLAVASDAARADNYDVATKALAWLRAR